MLTILTAPIRAVIGFMTLVVMMFNAIIIYLVINDEVKRKEMIEICQRHLCRLLLVCLHVEVHYIGQVDKNARVFVSNHISWLDALLFMPAPRLRFIAKSEVKNWPILGLLAQLLGTVFIRRDNKFQVYRSLPNAQRHIQEGDNLMVFPEGTTTIGVKTDTFRPMMFEVAVREKSVVQPVAIRYWNHKKTISQTTPFIDDDGIFMSIMKLLFERKTIAHVHFLPTMDASKLNRKVMAAYSQQSIQSILNQPYNKPKHVEHVVRSSQVKA